MISDKVSKVNDSFTINMYDNGYMLEIGGRDPNGDYKNVKIMCNTLDDLIARVKEASELERDE